MQELVAKEVNVAAVLVRGVGVGPHAEALRLEPSVVAEHNVARRGDGDADVEAAQERAVFEHHHRRALDVDHWLPRAGRREPREA